MAENVAGMFSFLLLVAAAALAHYSAVVHALPVSAPLEKSDSYIFANTDSGQIRGQLSANTRKYLGVPYAQPPLGDLRWREPQKPKPWEGVRDALFYASDCPQKEHQFVKESSEDCLYLNVFSPPNLTDPLPVMVFIHGGAYESGGSSIPIYTGEYVVRYAAVVLVTFNYRLGSLGFLAGNIMRSRNPDGSVGNYGLQDQRMALRWVQDNIAAFGGDPKRVMIFGESAGAGSIGAHLLANKSVGLFQTAVMESGGFNAWSSVRMENAEATFEKFAKAADCGSVGDIMECLLNASVSKVLEAQVGVVITSASLNWAPTVDGVELAAWPETMAQEGRFASKVPTIVGTNSAEAAALVTELIGDTLNATAYHDLLQLLFGAAAAGLIEFAYPTTDYPTPWWALESILTDALFACPARRSVRWFAKESLPTYLYSFARTPTVTVIPMCSAPCHTAELPYVFHVNPLLPVAADLSLSTSMVRYWSSFADKHVPTASGQPAWPQYVRWLDRSLTLNDTISVASGLRVKTCNFWDVVQKFLPTEDWTAIFTSLVHKLRVA